MKLGLLKCKEFNAASINDKDIFLSWLAGYLSRAFENKDIQSSPLNPGYDRTIIWIEYYCHKYPNSTFYDSVKNYIKDGRSLEKAIPKLNRIIETIDKDIGLSEDKETMNSLRAVTEKIKAGIQTMVNESRGDEINVYEI